MSITEVARRHLLLPLRLAWSGSTRGALVPRGGGASKRCFRQAILRLLGLILALFQEAGRSFRRLLGEVFPFKSEIYHQAVASPESYSS